MCLPTDSTFICTADRRIAIITAYHSGCTGISDIIRPLVHRSVTVSTGTIGHSRLQSLNRLTVLPWWWSIECSPGEKKGEEALFVFDTVQDLFRTSHCVSMHHYRQATANNNTPAKACTPNFPWSVWAHRWLLCTDDGPDHVPGGWWLFDLSRLAFPSPPCLHSPFLTARLLLGARLSRLAPLKKTAPERMRWHGETSARARASDLFQLRGCKSLQQGPLLRQPITLVYLSQSPTRVTTARLGSTEYA